MSSYTGKKLKIMQRIVDWFMPLNCRKQFHIAAAKNKATCLDTICMMQQNRTKIAHEICNRKVA